MLRIYFMMKAQYLKTAMEYKFNFWMMCIGGIVMRTVLLGIAFVLFKNVEVLGGFKEGEVYLMMSLMIISEGMVNIFFDGIWYVPAMLFRGELDVVLCRPVPALQQVLSTELGLQGVGVLALGFVSLGMAISRLGFLSAVNVLMLLIFIVTGMVLRLSTFIIGVTTSFYMDTGGNNSNAFTLYSIGEYAKYPVHIYPSWLAGILLSVVPFGFIGYVPVLILRAGAFSTWMTPLLVVVTIVYFLLARAFFYHGIKKYESMGM